MHWFFRCQSELGSLETIKIRDEIFQKYCEKHFLTLSKILKHLLHNTIILLYFLFCLIVFRSCQITFVNQIVQSILKTDYFTILIK